MNFFIITLPLTPASGRGLPFFEGGCRIKSGMTK
jgi:hypothetical protein